MASTQDRQQRRASALRVIQKAQPRVDRVRAQLGLPPLSDSEVEEMVDHLLKVDVDDVGDVSVSSFANILGVMLGEDR